MVEGFGTTVVVLSMVSGMSKALLRMPTLVIPIVNGSTVRAVIGPERPVRVVVVVVVDLCPNWPQRMHDCLSLSSVISSRDILELAAPAPHALPFWCRPGSRVDAVGHALNGAEQRPWHCECAVCCVRLLAAAE